MEKQVIVISSDEKKRSELTDILKDRFDVIERNSIGEIYYDKLNISDKNSSLVLDNNSVNSSENMSIKESLMDKIKSSAEVVQTLLESVGNGITVSIIREGKINVIYSNKEYYSMIGIGEESSKSVLASDQLLPIYQEDKEEVRRIIFKSAHLQNNTTIEYRIVRSNGELRWLNAAISTIKIEGLDYPVQISIFTDITSEHETIDQLKFMKKTAHKILSQNNSEKAINDTLENVREYYASDVACIGEIDLSDKRQEITYVLYGDDGYSDEKNASFDLPEEWLEILSENKCVVAGNIVKENNNVQLSGEMYGRGIVSLIIAPLFCNNKLMGFLRVDNPVKSTSHFSALLGIGDFMSFLVVRRELEKTATKDFNTIQTLMEDVQGGFARLKMEPGGKMKAVYFNQGLSKLVNIPHETLVSKYSDNILQGIHPDDMETVLNGVKQITQSRGTLDLRCRIKCGDGSYIWVIIYGRITSDDDKNEYLNVYYTDARSQMEEEEKRRQLLDNFPFGAALYEYDGQSAKVLHINKRLWQLAEHEPFDLSSRNGLSLICPDDIPVLQQEVSASIRENRNAQCNVRIETGTGGYMPFRATSTVGPEKDGKRILYTSFEQISDETMSIQELFPTALSTMMSTIDDFSFVKDKNSHFICCSKSYINLMCKNGETTLDGKSDFDIFERKIAESIVNEDREIISSRKPKINYLETIPLPDNNVMISNTSKYPILDTSGNVVGIYGVSRDVTEERKKESHLELLTNSIRGGIASYIVSEKELKIQYFNEGYYKWSDYTREEYESIVNKDLLEIIYEEDRKKVSEKYSEIQANLWDGNDFSWDYRCTTKDGDIRWKTVNAVLLKMEDDFFYLNVVRFDITEQKNNEERLRLSDEEYKLAMAHIGVDAFRFDVAGRYLVRVTPPNKLKQMPSCVENVPYECVTRGIVSQSTSEAYISFFERIISGEKEVSATFQMIFPNQSRWINATGTTLFSDDGKPVSAIVTYADVTEQQEKEAIYKRWQQNTRGRDEDSYTLFSCNLNKNSKYELMEGKMLSFWKYRGLTGTFDDRTMDFAETYVHEDDREKYISFLNLDTMFANYYRFKRLSEMDFRIYTPDGKIKWIRLFIELVEYPNSTDILAYMLFDDIDKLKKEEFDSSGNAKPGETTGEKRRIFLSGEISQIQLSGEKGQDKASGGKSMIQLSGEKDQDKASVGKSSIQLTGEKGQDKASGGKSMIQVSGEKDQAQVSGENSSIQLSGEKEQAQVSGGKNQVQFINEMNEMIREIDDDEVIALLTVDIDGLNLLSGSPVADIEAVQTDSVNLIDSVLSSSDLMCRSQDGIFMVGISQIKSRDEVLKKAENINELLKDRMYFSKGMLPCIGIAVCPDNGLNFGVLYKRSIKALNYSKKNEIGSNVFFDDIE